MTDPRRKQNEVPFKQHVVKLSVSVSSQILFGHELALFCGGGKVGYNFVR